MNPTVSFAKSRSTGEPATVDAQGRMQVRSTITALPRTRVIQVTPEHGLSECRSAVFEFIVFEFIDAPGYHCTRKWSVAYLHLAEVD